MYSETLRIMDDNTILYMVDEFKSEILYCDEIISQKDAEIQRLREELAQHKNTDDLK